MIGQWIGRCCLTQITVRLYILNIQMYKINKNGNSEVMTHEVERDLGVITHCRH